MSDVTQKKLTQEQLDAIKVEGADPLTYTAIWSSMIAHMGLDDNGNVPRALLRLDTTATAGQVAAASKAHVYAALDAWSKGELNRNAECEAFERKTHKTKAETRLLAKYVTKSVRASTHYKRMSVAQRRQYGYIPMPTSPGGMLMVFTKIKKYIQQMSKLGDTRYDWLLLETGIFKAPPKAHKKFNSVRVKALKDKLDKGRMPYDVRTVMQEIIDSFDTYESTVAEEDIHLFLAMLLQATCGRRRGEVDSAREVGGDIVFDLKKNNSEDFQINCPMDINKWMLHFNKLKNMNLDGKKPINCDTVTKYMRSERNPLKKLKALIIEYEKFFKGHIADKFRLHDLRKLWIAHMMSLEDDSNDLTAAMRASELLGHNPGSPAGRNYIALKHTPTVASAPESTEPVVAPDAVEQVVEPDASEQVDMDNEVDTDIDEPAMVAIAQSRKRKAAEMQNSAQLVECIMALHPSVRAQVFPGGFDLSKLP